MRTIRRWGLGALVVLGACQTGPEWSYEGATGPEYWGYLSPRYLLAKEGKSQSPIDLAGAEDGSVGALGVDYKPNTLEVENTGHTMRVAYDNGSTITLDGEVYDLEELTFRSPSEHTFKGQTMPLEVQLLHRGPGDAVAIVSVFVGEGQMNPFLQKIWDYMPSVVGTESRPGVTLDVAELVPADKTLYRYSGSLTTPPCTENVQWLVLKQPVEASAGQIARFRAFYHNNARPTQPLHARTVLVGGGS